jgi:hypothetical protein
MLLGVGGWGTFFGGERNELYVPCELIHDGCTVRALLPPAMYETGAARSLVDIHLLAVGHFY